MGHRAKKLLAATLSILAFTVNAHFQLLLADKDIIDDIPALIVIKAIFTHPMNMGPVMEMGKPVQFGVSFQNRKINLLDKIIAYKISGKTCFKLNYTFKQPGDYIFYIEPAPYWEASEEKMIIHYTKVVVDVMEAGEGWNNMIGFPVEIEALTRPYSLYKNNIFQGIVKKGGKAVPFAEVEVEYYNEGKKYKAPYGIYTTQLIKADANGVFSYAMPKAGWWGFAALIDGDKKIKNPQGKKVDVELGALIWVKTKEMKRI